jgi:hypothetical protein
VIEAGTKNLGPDAIRQMLGDLKLPREAREALSSTLSQLDETKNGVYRAISKEVRELLDRTSLADELAKALSLLTLEVKMEVRFKPSSLDPNSKGLDASVRFKRSQDTQSPERAESGATDSNHPESSKSETSKPDSSKSERARPEHPRAENSTEPNRNREATKAGDSTPPPDR